MKGRATGGLAEGAASEGILDVAYTTADSPFGPLLLAATRRGVVRIGLPAQDGEELLTESPRGSRRGCSRRRPVSRTCGASSTSTSKAACRTSTFPSTGSSARTSAAALCALSTASPTADAHIHRGGEERRQRARRPRRRLGLRLEPDPDRRPLSSRAAYRRRPRRLRRRAGDEGVAAQARGRRGRPPPRASKTTSSARILIPSRPPLPMPAKPVLAIALLTLFVDACPGRDPATLETTITEGCPAGEPAIASASASRRPCRTRDARRRGPPLLRRRAPAAHLREPRSTTEPAHRGPPTRSPSRRGSASSSADRDTGLAHASWSAPKTASRMSERRPAVRPQCLLRTARAGSSPTARTRSACPLHAFSRRSSRRLSPERRQGAAAVERPPGIGRAPGTPSG